MARDDTYKVVLVDADLRRPSTASVLGISDCSGLIDYLSTDYALEDVLVRPDIDNLTVLPGRADVSGAAVPELLTSKKMAELIDKLHQRIGGCPCPQMAKQPPSTAMIVNARVWVR